MENQTTVKDVLTDVVRTLNEINVPVSKINEIGIPIAMAIHGIELCLDAFRQSEEAQQHELQAEIVKVDESDSTPEGEEDA